MRELQTIIIHHSLTKDSKTVSWNAIRKYHISIGFTEIGYHYGVELINNDYEILVGRPLHIDGAHTKGHNKNSIGVCVIGNYDYYSPTIEIIKKLVLLVTDLCLTHNITIQNIVAHNNFSNKSCPGRLFDMDDLRRQVIKKLFWF